MSVAEQKQEVQRVLKSPQFRRSPKLQRLLELICDYHFNNKSGEINEFVIAAEAFGKGAEFDPGHDSLVRVQAREARRRLREYYQSEGAGSALMLDIPPGHYSPIFVVTEPSAPTPAVTLPTEIKPAWRGIFRRSLTVSAPIWSVALIVCAVSMRGLFLAFRGQLRSPMSSAAAGPLQKAHVTRLWGRLLESDVPTVVVLSNPPVGDDPVCQGDAQRSDPLKSKEEDPCPDKYTGMGEAIALHVITDLFESAKRTPIVKESRMVTADDIKRYNLILLGGRKANVWAGRLGPDVNMSSPDPHHFSSVFDARTGLLARKDGAVIAFQRRKFGDWALDDDLVRTSHPRHRGCGGSVG